MAAVARFARFQFAPRWRLSKIRREDIDRIDGLLSIINDAAARGRSMLKTMKKLAIALSIFPGILFVIALLSFVICSIAERNLPPGGVNIGLSLLLMAALINIPTIVAWLIFLVRRRGEGMRAEAGDDARRGDRRGLAVAYAATGIVIGVLSSVAIAVYARTHPAPDGIVVSSIEEWEKRTQRPGFTLLDRADLPEYYVCVYETGFGEVTFCYNRKNSESDDIHSFAVYDTEGRNLQDPARWNRSSDLNSPGDTFFIEGMVVPVRPDYSGTIQMEFKKNSGAGLELVYTKRLPYTFNGEEGGAGQSATRFEPESESASEGSDEPQPELVGRLR